MSDQNGKKTKKNLLLYSCSGAANVAEIADRAARQLMEEGHGAMFCLAGLGAGIDSMIQAARDAELNILLDGCSMDCALRIFENCGITNVIQLKVTDMGIEKTKGVRATEEEVARAVDFVKQELRVL